MVLTIPGAKTTRSTLENIFPEFYKYITELLNLLFNDKSFTVYEIFREGGRARAAHVIECNDLVFTVDISLSNPQSGFSKNHFDRARYRIYRLILLKKLGNNYPETFYFPIDGPWLDEGPLQLIVIFQEFIPYKVCSFKDYNSILEFLKLLFKSAKLGILLDYNQNHWLYESTKNHGKANLYYVDKDYADDGRSFKDALSVGFDQSTLYLTLDNSKHFASALASLSSDKTKKKAIEGIIIPRIKENLKRLKERPQSKIVTNRIKSLEIILDRSL